MKLLLLAFYIITIQVAVAEVDEFNTYRWNRNNEIQANGRVDKGPWYEWWYYKVVLPEENKAFFFVYGIVNPWDIQKTMKGTRSSVGFGDFNDFIQVEKLFSVREFAAEYDETFLTVGNNSASDKHIIGFLENENNQNFSWDINIVKNWKFNATSWATGRGMTNIEWYPAQASASCSGSIISNDKQYQFKDVPCYQDRNWGNSFPEWWTWIVSNHFIDSKDTALVIGGGKPKFFRHFNLMEGVAIGLKHKGREYAWRPNHFDRVKMEINFGKWEVTASNKTHVIEVSAYAPREKFMDLQFMTPHGEIFHDYEALLGTLTVRLYEKRAGARRVLVETLHSEHAGIEYGSKDAYPIFDLFSDSKLLFNNY